MTHTLRLRLSLLFFGQYLATGFWFVPLGAYLSKTLGFDDIIGAAYGMIGVATIISTLFAGMIADRFFSTEKVLGVITLLAGVTLFWLSSVGQSKTLFLTGMLIHCLFYTASIPLGVALAFNAVSNPARDFPSLRIFGSVGFIAAGLLVGLIPGAGQSSLPMKAGALVHILMGLYCFTLPKTPPQAKSEGMDALGLLGLDIVKGVKDRAFWIFVVAILVMVIPKKFYDGFLNNYLVEKSVSFHFGGLVLEPTAVQTLGQIMEMGTLLCLPFLLARFGIKWIMVLGMVAWIGRFLLWAFGFHGAQGIMPMILLGIMMHGISYDFFFVSGQIWLDRRFPPASRARAQAFYWFILSGLGVVLGSNVAGAVYTANTVSSAQHNWTAIWLAPAAVTAVALVLFARFFKERPVVVVETTSER